jgi:cytochrome c
MGSLKFVAIALLAGLLGNPAFAQSAPTYGLGRTPSAEEIRARDINIGPTGDELPPGRGTPKEGEKVFTLQGCIVCHGPEGAGRGPRRVEIEDKPRSSHLETGADTAHCTLPVCDDECGITSIAVYAAQERKELSPPMSLRADAPYLLFVNKVIPEDEVLETKLGLPKSQDADWRSIRPAA